MNLRTSGAQFGKLWSSLSLQQRVSIGLAAAVVAGGLIYFAFLQRQRDFRPLFTGMSAEDAGSVIAKLKESNVEYQVSEGGGTVLVPSSKAAETRLQLAAAGLPRSGRMGFELFDKTNLGATDFAEQVNYRRALEGELERSIRGIAEVEQARVHLSFAKDSVFVESKLPAKASVLLTLRHGARLTPANVRAVVHLVASAVEGLTPESVTLTDSAGNLLNRPKKTQTDEAASDELTEYRQKMERDLLAKVNSTLDPLVGSGKYRVGLTVDCDLTSGEQSEEVYDPEKSVMLTTQKTEETSGSTPVSGGVPGTPSSLPRPAARAGATGGANLMRRSENVTYQSSRTVRRTRIPQGAIRRISASVLLDQGLRWDLKGNGYERVLIPPTAESLQSIRELVTAALGLVPARGDLVVVQTLPFESTLATPPPPPRTPAAPAAQGAPPAAGAWTTWIRDWRVQAGAGVAAVLLMVGTVLVLRKRRRSRAFRNPIPSSGASDATGALPAQGESEAIDAPAPTGLLLAAAQAKVAHTATVESLLEELRSNTAADPRLAAKVVRTWLAEENEA